MDATLTVPAVFVPYLRRGLFGEWASEAEKLCNLAQQFGSGAPDGVYMSPLQGFFTLCVLLGEVGWKDSPSERDVIISLSVGAPHIIDGLKEEHYALVQRLNEMPSNMNKATRETAAANAAELAEFIRSVEEQAARARLSRLKPTPIQPTPQSLLSVRTARARRTHHK